MRIRVDWTAWAIGLVALAMAGCGSSQTVTCDPECPGGWHCTPGGCALDDPNAVVDLGVAMDQAGGCSPACAGATPHCSPQGACVACLEDGHCPTGQVCKSVGQSRACLPGCMDDARCGGGTMRCCDGQCADTGKDALHCGGCGTRCDGINGRSECSNGSCALKSCNAGWGDCNADAADGCETNLHVDTANCTGCGMTCKLDHAIAGCADQCHIRACEFGWDDCDGKEETGCEMNVLANSANCGSCGSPCANVPHAKNSCVNGSCQLQSCDAGFADCDGNPVNGCEITTSTDARNCGACGNACAQGLVCVQSLCTCPQCNLPNARSTCVNLKCAVATCNVNWGDCDGQPQNGCERDLTSDAANCGQCGKACAQGLVCVNGSCTCPNCVRPNARTACVNNVCQLDQCFAGWGNCDGADGNGCETDLSVDRANCGGCGQACPNGQFCFGGQCQAKFVFQNTQVIDGATVTCSSVVNNASYTQCTDLLANAMSFPNGLVCALGWDMRNPRTSDTIGFCQSLTGTAKAESDFQCNNSVPRATWFNHVWASTNDNGYTVSVRCYY